MLGDDVNSAEGGGGRILADSVLLPSHKFENCLLTPTLPGTAFKRYTHFEMNIFLFIIYWMEERALIGPMLTHHVSTRILVNILG